MYLTKSDIIETKKCDTKLYYKKNNYPKKATDEAFMEQLAEAGHFVKEMARVYHSGTKVDNSYLETALTLTKKLLEEDSAIIFDAVFRHDKRLATIDMVYKIGDSIHVYEITSRVFTGSSPELYNKNGTVKAENSDLFDGLTFMCDLVSKNHPKLLVYAHLLFLDREKVNYHEDLHMHFRTITEVDMDGRSKISAVYDGDVEMIKQNYLLTSVDVTEKVDDMKKSMDERCTKLEEFIGDKGCRKPESKIGRNCFGCEYRVKEERSGFNECWKDLANAKNHIMDLYNPTMQKVNKEYAIDALINENKNEMSDWLDLELSEGETLKRQKIQIENTLSGREYIGSDLKKTLEDLSFPLHFVDFETCAKPIPYHSGHNPYQMIGFQWSMHTLHEDGTLEHKQFINEEPNDPNDRFLISLAENLTEQGTFLMWHHHESTVLKQLLNSLGQYVQENWQWKNEDNKQTYEKILRILEKGLVDMNKITKYEYFHPLMGSRTSIKKVLPAVWQTSKHLENDTHLKDLRNKNVADPYLALCEEGETVKSGTDAIVQYDEMLCHLKRGDKEKAEKIKNSLLKYCHLDTLAMYIIYKHWKESVKEKELV